MSKKTDHNAKQAVSPDGGVSAPAKIRFKRRRREKQLNRSMAGNTLLFALMIFCGVFMVLPLVMIINNCLKPLDELFQYPPKLFVRNPT